MVGGGRGVWERQNPRLIEQSPIKPCKNGIVKLVRPSVKAVEERASSNSARARMETLKAEARAGLKLSLFLSCGSRTRLKISNNDAGDG